MCFFVALDAVSLFGRRVGLGVFVWQRVSIGKESVLVSAPSTFVSDLRTTRELYDACGVASDDDNNGDQPTALHLPPARGARAWFWAFGIARSRRSSKLRYNSCSHKSGRRRGEVAGNVD